MYLLQRNTYEFESTLLGVFWHKRVGKGHELVNNNKREAETCAEGDDLLTDCLTKSSGTVVVFVHQLGHRSVSNNITGVLDDVEVKVANKIGRNI